MTPEALEAVRTKLADAVPAPSFADAAQQATSSAMQSQALQTATNMGLGAAGVGMGARGLVGIYNLLRRNMRPPRTKPLGPVMIDVPVPRKEKRADAAPAPSAISKFLSGGSATTQAGVPWAIPAAVAAGGVGLYGGWKGMDAILDHRRKAMLQEELDKARTDYDTALFAQYDNPKTAAERVAVGLDKLYDALQDQEKSANLANLGGMGLGAYGTVAGVSGTMAALTAYAATKKRQQAELLRKAQASRLRRMYAAQPTPLYARPLETAGAATPGAETDQFDDGTMTDVAL